ncbi:uncharacterized protein [Choristoneura fumiferana]|uniref:uncharacterized protein n=1 Tax=Choristoneura fumiferana TaxID=7141 RepID=UPI003D158643
MDYKKYQINDEPEIIIIDDAEETITVKENLKKPKTKKHHKRKVKLGKNNNKNMETLYITQKLNVKKTKFNCIINVNNVPKKEKKRIHPSSIIRTSRNECKREAYYNRIVPVCTRHNCFSGTECCRTASNGEYRIRKTELRLAIKRSGMLSPVSSGPLPDSVDISYEDVSDKSFSSVDELDTLIKRTKQRENQFLFPIKAYSALSSSTPIMSEEATSTYSEGSLHSTSTLLLRPLETEAYSPTTSPGYMGNVSGPYSPIKTPDWINYMNIDFKPTESPYSPSDPTNTLAINEDIHEYCKTGNGVKAGQYSPASPPYIETIEEHKNKNHDKHNIYNKQNGRVVTSKINGSDHIKVENIKREEESENEDFINNRESFRSEINENNNILIKTENIKRENENSCDINENFEVFVKIEKP